MPRKPTADTSPPRPAKSARAIGVVKGDTVLANVTSKKAQRQYSTAEIVKAIHEADGLLSRAAELLGCSRNAIYRRANEPEIAEAIKDARAFIVFDAEDALRNRIKDGDTTAIIFTLKTLGKQHGYIERHELTGRDGAPLLSFEDLKRRVVGDDNE